MIYDIILYSTIALGIIYLGILIFKGIAFSKIILNTLIVFIFILTVLFIRLHFKEESKPVINNTTTTTSTTTTITTTNNNYVGKTNKGYTIKYIDGAYYIDGYIIANKSFVLKEDWIPQNTNITITEEMDGFCKECIDKEAYSQWIKMKNDAYALGLNLWIQSGYRSYNYQKDLYNGYVASKGKDAADKSSARPGSSEHQTGLAFDLNTITTVFKDTDEGKWVNDNCYLYGYIIRYPEGKTEETGYIYEPWHLRYVGKELAKALYNNGNWLTMENYFGIDSKYE